jgi:cellulose synthase/poly-beta-1,6-N-acetylglucosamine synthase-like glycosyltransferase
MIVIHLLTLLLFIYLLPVLLYLFALATAGRIGKLRPYTSHPDKARIALLIPSYKDDSVIVETAKQALTQNYPGHQYSVTVIADQLQPATILQLKELPINLIVVNLEKSMKARSLNTAFKQLSTSQHDLAMILDADNLMSPDTLEKVNHAWHSGWKAIQCHRTAKNQNNSLAVLDALSEEVNNTIYRKGQRVWGLSCALIGSGMAFDFRLIADIFALPQIQDNAGEDREIDTQLVKQLISVEYIEDAFVFDEKVQRKEVYEKQRTRWLGTQIDHLKSFLSPEMRPVRTRRLYLHKLFQCIFLPRLLLMVVFLLVLALSAMDLAFGWQTLFPAWPWWLGLIALYGCTLLIAIPASFYNRRTVVALLKVPVLTFAMLKALLGIKKHKTGFLHTPKEFTP